MAVGAIGNTIFVNQMTHSASSVQNAHNNRIEFQNMVAQSASSEKDEKVLEVRPTEENQSLNPDRDHQKDEAKRENERSEKKDTEENEQELEKPKRFKLDIKV